MTKNERVGLRRILDGLARHINGGCCLGATSLDDGGVRGGGLVNSVAGSLPVVHGIVLVQSRVTEEYKDQKGRSHWRTAEDRIRTRRDPMNRNVHRFVATLPAPS